jgi:hypothetical protein
MPAQRYSSAASQPLGSTCHSLAFSFNKSNCTFCTKGSTFAALKKRDSSKIGGKTGSSKGKQGEVKGYMTARAGTSNTWAAAQDAATSIMDKVQAGMSAAAQAARLQTLPMTAALS